MATWNTDAQLAATVDERFLATNAQLDSFLSDGVHGKFLLVAAKGMGKTLLLRHKRKQIEQDHKDYFTIPRNSTADYVKPPSSPSKGMTDVMQSKAFWQDLWTLSIAVSVLLNYPHDMSDDEKKAMVSEIGRADLPAILSSDLLEAINNKYVNQRPPSGVLDIFLQTTVKAVELVRKRGVQILTELVKRHVDSGCAVFIDSFDQAISTAYPDNLEIWCAGQAGLAKAAWELSRHSRHLKIFVTIRQEAYSYFGEDPEINNIKGSTLLIEYSKDDLLEIFEKAILHYEGSYTISQFVGLAEIYNGYLRRKEPVFDYIYRHTIGTPRWLMVIGEKISFSRKERGLVSDNENKKHQKIVTSIVNEESSVLAKTYLEAEMSAFFQGDKPQRYIEGILGKIGSTVLSRANLVRISDHFLRSSWAGTSHPFCLLYNFGLLGYVAMTPQATDFRQKFKKPYQFDWKFDHILPSDPSIFYLVHPAIHHLIQANNHQFKYNHVRIGDGLSWGKAETQRVRDVIIRIFVSYAHADSDTVIEIVDAIEDYLGKKSILHDIWFDKWKMKSGRWVQDQMIDGLHNSDYLILMVSSNSIGSEAVAVEWKTKFGEKLSKGEDTVFPFIIDDTQFNVMPDYLQNIYAYKYSGKQEKIARLIEDILFWKKEEGKKRSQRCLTKASSGRAKGARR